MEYLLAEQLAAMSANQLYTQLGAIHVANKHALFSTLNLQKEALIFAAQDTTSVGKSFFNNLNRTACNFFCGDGANADSLAHLLVALRISKNSGETITAVAGVLKMCLGWAPLVAGIVASLLIKVVFPPVYDTLCADWAARL